MHTTTFRHATTAAPRAIERAFRRARHAAVVTVQEVNGVRRRLNIENSRQLKQAGLAAGSRFRIRYAPGVVEIIADAAGTNVISPKRFPKRDGTETLGERLDLRSQQIEATFGDQERVLALYLDGRVVIVHLPTVARTNARLAQLFGELASGEMSCASLYTGIGTLDAALHEGLGAEGVAAHTVFANDVWPEAIDALLADNPAADDATVTFAGGIEQVIATGRLPRPTFVAMGIPCKGASKLNIRDRDLPEMHAIAGHQVLNALMALQHMGMPPLVLIENVVPWSETVSCSMLRRVLDEQGYETRLIGDYAEDGTYLGIKSSDHGTIERRVRMALLAFPKGLRFEAFQLEKSGPSTVRVGEIRVPESTVDPRDYDKGMNLDGEHKKEKGFRNRIVSDDDTQTPSMSAACWKMRPEDPKFTHPEDPTRWRLPVPEEHARLKGHDPRLVNSLVGNSLAHTALGNGTARGAWVAFGRALVRWLRSEAERLRQAPVAPLALPDFGDLFA